MNRKDFDVNPEWKPRQLTKKRQHDDRFCKKQSNGGFECPASKPPITIMAIPWWPKTSPSLLIKSLGEF